VLTTEDNKALVVGALSDIIINISFDYLSANKLHNTYHNSEFP